ncbi:MAG: hypothetical protein K5945_03460 [Bacteroidaceae bacterium]|nr:hypothetical protein [Bacteroidaceae bacterium]
MNKKLISLAFLLLPAISWADDVTVNSAEDWQTVCSSAETYANGTITLGADIDVTTPFPAEFTGTLDGQGHTVTYNLTNPGKFALINSTGEGALIKDLKVGGTIEATTAVAGVVYTVNGATTIQNVKVSAVINSSSYPLGGFVVEAKSRVSIIDSEFSGTLWTFSAKSADCAGFISRVTDNGAFTITNCAFSGTVREETKGGAAGAWRASGFVSTVEKIAEVEDCFFTNCVYTGTILQGNGSVRLAGFVGSPNSNNVSYYFKNCLMAGSVQHWVSNNDNTYDTDANNIIVGATSKAGKFYSENCYYSPSRCLIQKYTNAPSFDAVSDEQLSSGALCFSLNGNQEEINFFQTLGSDPLPLLDKTHGQVFANGRKHCNGDDYEDVTYNNTSGSTQTDEHNFVDGICDYCHQLQIDGEGFFHVVSQKGWDAAAAEINSGNTSLNIKLEADVEQHSTLAGGYFGTFDGQGHSIDVTMGSEENSNTTVGSGKVSLFGNMGSATIRNVIFTGKLIGSCVTAPIACYSSGKVTVENVLSLVEVIQTTTADGNCSGFIGQGNGSVTYRNCVFAGKVQATKDAGCFMGWSDANTHNLENCFVIGDVTINQGNSAVFCRIKDNNTVNMTNCYYVPGSPLILNGNGKEISPNAKAVDMEQVTSGALCYLLNGDQSAIHFYQTLNTDQYPVPFANGHAQVFANGHKHCNGDDYEGISYNNTSGETVQDPHNFVGHVCDYCGIIETDENGVFHIVSETGFAAFSKAVANNSKLSAVLESDITIDMGSNTDCPMIGSPKAYEGTFDGQGHTITATIDAGGSTGGIFSTIKGATIRNVVAEGSLRNAGQAGFVGGVDSQDVLLENIIVKMDIEGTLNVGGLVGNGSSYSGKTLTFRNCMFAGKVNYVGPNNSNGIGGLMGWVGSGANFNVENCIVIGEIDLSSNPEKSAHFVRANNGCTFKVKGGAYIPVPGVMYVNGHTAEANTTPVACENADDGALCYAANGSSFQNPAWYQDLGVDEMPTLDDTKGIVYKSAEGYSSNPKSAYATIINDLMAMGEEFANPEEHPAQLTLIEAFLEAMEALKECTSFEQLVAAYYPAIEEQYQIVAASQKAYAEYIQKVEQTLQYIEDNASDFKGGPAFQKLESYLSDELTDPSEDGFPNGSYAYIIDAENLLLDAAGLKAEMAFIDKLVNDALNEGLNPGADATSFIANADFSNGFTSWEGTKMTTAAKSESYEGRYVAESWSDNAFDMHQTITLPENGVYELTLNGAYRINEFGNSHQHSAMVYLNENKNYLPAVFEDMLPVADAQDKVNCWLTGTADYPIKDVMEEIIGYTTHGQQGAACAFFSGRYPVRILANVTDNTLTVGICNSHALTSVKEWVAAGNLKLTYLGELSEAGDALDATLANMKARADYLLAQDPEQETSDDVKYYPNFDAKLRAALQEKVDAIATTTEPADKYALVQAIGDIFEQIVTCKANYGKMLIMAEAFVSTVESMAEAGEITEDEKNNAYNPITKTMNGYVDGSYTSEEAAKGGDLASSDMYPTFNEEGTVQIDNGLHLNLFAALVNSGSTKLNAELTNDVTVGESFVMIGKDAARYAGTFDGKGHTINATITKPETNEIGIFSYVANATICNLKATGSIVGSTNVGMIGRSIGKTIITNVESSLNLLGYNNVGGFIGNASSGPQEFRNCLFTGKSAVDMNISGSSGAGGFVGWSADNTMKASHCLCIGEVEGAQLAYYFRVKCDGTVGTAGSAGCYITADHLYLLKRGCKDQEPEVFGQEALVSGTPLWWGEFMTDVIEVIEPSQVQNGEICFLLNDGNTVDPTWFQTLGEDDNPVLDNTHKIVYKLGDSMYSNDDTPFEVPAPEADVLDVVFHEDGSAEDVSPMHSTVELVGTTSSTYYNETYKRYAARFTNPWSKTCTGYYKVDFETNDAIRNALADGHSLEMLVMPDYEGDLQDVEAKPFSAMQGGGTGFLVCKTNASGSGGKNVFTFLPNVTENGNSTWRWTTSGVVPAPKTYYHVVGIWNKEEAKAYIYVNGELCKMVDAPGQFRFATAGCNWFCIGGDADPNGGGQGWTGDVAIARAYNKPLTSDEVAALWKKIQNPDGIEGISQDDAVPFGIFRLDGMRVEKAEKGIYIMNGKKVLVK